MSDKSRTAFLRPSLSTLARKASAVASGPIPWEVVSTRTNALTKSRYLRANFWATIPPIEKPIKTAFLMLSSRRQTHRRPIAASIARGMKTCRRRKPLDAGMIGRQGVFQIKNGPKRTALENLKTAGAQQAHNLYQDSLIRTH